MYKLFANLFFTVLFALAMTCSALAQDNYEATLDGWLVSLDEAYEQSKETGKPILANFTGSDWCGYCKVLSRSVFRQEEFEKWAKKNVILLELDFPKRFTIPKKYRQQNESLRKAFKVGGYPTIFVFNLNKNEKTQGFEIQTLGRTGYTKKVKDFTNGVDKMLAKS